MPFLRKFRGIATATPAPRANYSKKADKKGTKKRKRKRERKRKRINNREIDIE